jgi:hypothetical protein
VKIRFIVMVGMVLLAAPGLQADLTGRWSCNDGGTYYLRQENSQLYWYGEAAGSHPAWANVFSGHVADDRIEGRWIDVPKGRTAGSGRLSLTVEADGNRLRAVERSGGFGGSIWRRRPASTRVAPHEPLRPEGAAECAVFDPKTLSVQSLNGSWKIVDEKHWLFDFGRNPAAARRAAEVMRHYRMDRICRVGRRDPIMSYLLSKGGTPTGALAGEDCIAFDPRRAAVSKVQGRWKIVSGKAWIFDFGDQPEDARRALAVIRRYGFTHVCWVGRPAADFLYFRR